MWVQCVDHVHRPHCQGECGLFHQSGCQRITQLGGIKHLLGAKFRIFCGLVQAGAFFPILCQGFVRPLHNALVTCIGLQATPAPAAAGAGLAHLNAHMAQLGSVTVVPGYYFAIDHNPPANSGAQSEEDQAVELAIGPKMGLA